MQKIKNFKQSIVITVLITFLTFFSFATQAVESAWKTSPDKEGQIRLVGAKYSENGDVKAGLHVKLSDSWKTYWLRSGDSGMPPQFSFEGSENISAIQALFPSPKRYSFYGIESFAYGKEVVFPILLKAKDVTKPVIIKVNVKWAICDEICIFEDANLSLNIEPKHENTSNSALISKYYNKVPKAIEASDVLIESVVLEQSQIILDLTSNQDFYKNIDVFVVEDSENFRFPTPIRQISPDGKSVRIILPYEKKLASASLEGQALKFFVANGENSVYFSKKFDVSVEDSAQYNFEAQNALDELHQTDEASASGGEKALNITLWEAIIGAIIGGLILNIMPCVLPVLSLKIMGAIKHSGHSKAQVRKSFLFTTLGILFSFLVLAALTITLKSLGNQIGWGIQFQEPAFLIFLAFILALFSINQFGFFEVILPQSIQDKLNKKLNDKDAISPLGSFLTGAFATLMATPCTAPFLGTAISFALSASAAMILLIFFFMGVGLALPYILVMITPSAIKVLPKPGNWMIKFRKFLGVLLLLTVLWVLTIFSVNAGFLPAAILFTCLCCMYWFMWLAKRKNLSPTRSLLSIVYLMIIAFVIPLYFYQSFKGSKDMQEMWIPYSQEKLDELIADDKTIFVDVTAEWCLTCQFNKLRVTNKMEDYFRDEDVALIKADYTTNDPEISKYLAKYQAYAIPFNIVYGPKDKEGIILPTVLTRENVTDAIVKAGGKVNKLDILE